jgi:DNA polymerase V
MDFFTDYEKKDEEKRIAEIEYEKEKSRQRAVLDIRKRYGGNSILKGMNLEDGATAIDRNMQIGGHKA